MLFFMVFLLMISNVMAKDCGTHGTVFQIQEIDLLGVFQKRLARHKNQKTITKYQPSPNLKLGRAVKTRSWLYDPSITLKQDLRLPDGRLIHQKGTRFNPLDTRPLTKTLVFIDGRDAAQMAWVKAQHPKAALILTTGNPQNVQEVWPSRVFFDQGGAIVKKLGIQNVPAFVRQEGDHLRITEVSLEEG